MPPKLQRSNLDDETVEQINTMLDSPAMKLLIQVGLRPSLRLWRFELLNNTNLREADRIAHIEARRALERSISSLFNKVNRPVPKWIEDEFNA